MASQADYMKVAKEIDTYMNAFHLAFKTYQIEDFNVMIKAVAGDGARIGPGIETFNSFKTALLERGFTIYPSSPDDAQDGYVRVIRANSLVGSLLNAFRYVGPDGDSELAKILTVIKSRKRADDFAPELD